MLLLPLAVRGSLFVLGMGCRRAKEWGLRVVGIVAVVEGFGGRQWAIYVWEPHHWCWGWSSVPLGAPAKAVPCNGSPVAHRQPWAALGSRIDHSWQSPLFIVGIKPISLKFTEFSSQSAVRRGIFSRYSVTTGGTCGEGRGLLLTAAYNLFINLISEILDLISYHSPCDAWHVSCV